MFRTAEGKVFALLDRCPHKHGRLSQGIVHGGAVEEGEDLALGSTEHRDVVAARDLHGAAAAHGDFIGPADVEPFGGAHASCSCGVKRAIGA